MKKIKRTQVKMLLFISFFVLVAIGFVIKNTKDYKISYLALGDSIPAGISPYSGTSSIKYEKSYPDFISEYLGRKGKIEYTKKYAVPGSTTNDLLNEIRNNISKENEPIRNKLKKASIITIGIGANDLLQSYNLKVIDSQSVINTISINLSDIVDEIRKVNSSVRIYIIGYYNLFPLKINIASDRFNQDYPELNRVLEEVAVKKKAKFVGTSEVFKDNYTDFLPVTGDVHPNELGHELISKRIIIILNK
ncbi:SGNH/GDSL hydrolase family protein [Paenibacillus frigoriresistens]|uniref:SGNH/GDSL hydrolase family protein n=1 Tax=Paenibacillus alginolyticus TaxID=59839 RepID=UPI00156579F6|nr:SGNH/GDSL hydrolase family protein [Paenibacillus frigoriresistens]NRF95793.1 SGNH/GDSL hydrolase family protein [Paenibacillus frigoriresistens]